MISNTRHLKSAFVLFCVYLWNVLRHMFQSGHIPMQSLCKNMSETHASTIAVFSVNKKHKELKRDKLLLGDVELASPK